MELADFNFEEGEVLLLDKPLTWSSFDVVRKVKNTLRIRKIGHAGTLDPDATGVLAVDCARSYWLSFSPTLKKTLLAALATTRQQQCSRPWIPPILWLVVARHLPLRLAKERVCSAL